MPTNALAYARATAPFQLGCNFRIGFGSEPNGHVGLARLHELSFDLVPGSTLRGIGPRRL